MRRRLPRVIVSVVIFLVIAVVPAGLSTGKAADGARQSHWPSFRGWNASGVSQGPETPTSWSIDTSRNIKWKTRIPGLGHSSPIIWGDRLFVTTAVSSKEEAPLRVGLYGDIKPVDDDSVHQWKVFCLDKRRGKILWERTAYTGAPKIKRHTKATHSNSTMATDGEHLIAFFGSEGLYCYNLEGKLLWKKDLGVLDAGYYVVPEAQWGFGSSPVIHKNMIVVQCDVQQNSFLAAFDVRDGKEIWRTRREDVPTWSTPTIHESSGRTQVIVNGYKHIGGYDFEAGKELWRMRGGGDIPAPTPVVAQGLVFITNAHGPMSPIYAVRLDAEGDISLGEGERSNRHVVWSVPRGGSYMKTPLVVGDLLYICRMNGVLACYDARTGKRHYEVRLGTGRTGFTASAVAAGDKIYFASEEGDVYVVKAGPEFELLAQNSLDEICMATPAISEGALFFRTRDHVVAVGE